MEKRSIEAIVSVLNAGQVRYLIAGGLAVIAHGHVRLTKDVDLIVDFETSNLHRAIAALSGLGYRPVVPVPFEDFADADKREEWIRNKNALVFMVFSDEHPTARIDLFIKAPLDFAAAFQRATFLEVSPTVRASFVGIEDLISLKKQAGRPLDLDDVEKLNFLQAEKQNAIQGDRGNPNGDDPWHYATFEGAVQLQLKINARTSLAEKLEWLEQAGRLARQLERQANVLASGRERD